MRKLLVGLMCLTVSIGCGKKKDEEGKASVSLTLRGATPAASFSPVHPLAAGLFTTLVRKSFTPVSIKAPIVSIGFSSEANLNVYECADRTGADCYVDLADPAALAAVSEKARKVAVEPGTYNSIGIWLCGSEGQESSSHPTPPFKIKGSVVIGGTTYHTAADGALSTEAASEDYASITPETPTCDKRRYVSYAFATPLELKKGQAAELTLLVAVEDFVHGAFSASGLPPPSQSCLQNGTATAEICTQNPGMLPYVGKGIPTMETYKISAAGKSGKMLLFFDEAGRMLGGITRALHTDDTESFDSYGRNLKSFKENDDGTLALLGKGDAGKDKDTIGTSFEFAAFQRASHTGTYVDHENSGASVSYTAEKL